MIFKHPYSTATFEEHTYTKSVVFTGGVAELDEHDPRNRDVIEYLLREGYVPIPESSATVKVEDKPNVVAPKARRKMKDDAND